MKEYNEPPKWADRFLRWYCNPKLIEQIQGDLHELYHWRVMKDGARVANRSFVADTIKCFRWQNIKGRTQNNNSNMGIIKNYFKTGWRSLVKQKSYTAINVAGLSIGIATSLLILLWVQDEYQKDKFHKNKDTLYQVLRNMHSTNNPISTTIDLPLPLADVLEEEYPEVEHAELFSNQLGMAFKRDDKTTIENGYYVGDAFLEIMSYDMIVGDPKSVLDELNSVVISDRLAKKYFGEFWQAEGEVIGSTFEVDNVNNEGLVIISGVFKDVPASSTIQFDYLLNMQQVVNSVHWAQNWDATGYYMLVKLRDDVHELDKLNNRISSEINKHEPGFDSRPFLTPYPDRYLFADYENGVQAGGRIEYVRMMFIVAIFIILIACINFMNLSTAKSTMRSKEIGVRKVLGAGKGGLRSQFLVEAIMISSMAVAVAILLIQLLLPAFNMLVSKQIFIDFTSLTVWGLLLGMAIITGLLSGSYPALLLSSYKILTVIKGEVKHTASSRFLRQGLVIAQFGISIVLVVGTLVVHQQIDYIMNKDLGVNRSNVMYTGLEEEMYTQYESFKAELLTIPGVSGVTRSSDNPLHTDYGTSRPVWEGKQPDEEIYFKSINAGYDWIETMGVTMVEGRSYRKDIPTDSAGFIINQKAAELMGFDEPLGKAFSLYGIDGEIVGVVKDFHMTSMYNEIEPLVMCFAPGYTWTNLIRIDGDVTEVVAGIEQVYKKYSPSALFTYEFMDEEFESQYNNEIVVGKLSNYFSIVAILISCLGLFGLASFSVSQKVKEIGIRKTLGASSLKIVMMLGGNFTLLVLVAFLVAGPVAYYFSTVWLSSFAYRTNPGFEPFLWVGIGAILIGAITVSTRVWKAASLNPATSLRDQ